VPRREDVLLKITTEGAGPVAASFDRAQRRVQDSIITEFRYLGRVVGQTFADHAPSDSGRTARNVSARVFFGQASAPRITVRTRSIDPDTGFNYLDVTRYGHRSLAIVPRRRLGLTIHGHRNATTGDGPSVVRAHATGSRPASDWVEDAYRAVGLELDDAEQRIARGITRLFA
jgi:hypothetical protein